MMTVDDFSDLTQAGVRLLMIVSALIHVYRYATRGRRATDRFPHFDRRRIDAVTLMFAFLNFYGVAFLLIRVFDAPLSQIESLRAYILPTTLISNLLLAIHFLNGQVNETIGRMVDRIKKWSLTKLG